MDFFERKLDDKNRLTVPAELRHEFEGGKVIITRGFKQYLHLYTEKVWNEKMEPALKGDILDERTADLNVQFRMGKQDTVMAVNANTKQCRVTLDQSLLDFAEIAKGGEVTAVRAGDYWRLAAKP